MEHVPQTVDNTYATIQPRSGNHGGSSSAIGHGPSINGSSSIHHGRMDPHIGDFADYATLRNNRVPSVNC